MSRKKTFTALLISCGQLTVVREGKDIKILNPQSQEAIYELELVGEDQAKVIGKVENPHNYPESIFGRRHFLVVAYSRDEGGNAKSLGRLELTDGMIKGLLRGALKKIEDPSQYPGEGFYSEERPESELRRVVPIELPFTSCNL